LQEEIFNRNRERRFAVLKVVGGRERPHNDRSPSTDGSSYAQTGRASSSAGAGNEGEDIVREKLVSSQAAEEEEQVSVQMFFFNCH